MRVAGRERQFMTIAVKPSMVTSHKPPNSAAGDAGKFILYDVSWQTYESLLRDLEKQHVSITYDGGTLELMSPLPKHERAGRLLARLVQTYTETRDIPVASFGMTTWRREDLARGLEADECFYIQHEPLIRGREDLSLDRDPPPDLAIEVDITRSSLEKQKIYAALGIPELWRFEDEQLLMFVLQTSGDYQQTTQSPSLPGLSPAQIETFMRLRLSMGETEWIRAFREEIAAQP